MSSEKIDHNNCFHCGDDCGTKPVDFDTKSFCCQGCRMVYEILAEKDACAYYDLSEHPGITIKGTGSKEKYAYLDNPDVVDSILEFKELGTSKVTFFIPIIHCSSCIWLLENLYKLHEGIQFSSVHFVKKEVYITYKDDVISFREVVELLDSIGYTPQIIQQEEKNKKPKKDYRILYQIGIAGFAFGNIMLFSLPQYFSAKDGMEPGLAQFFSYVNLILSLPVLFYADIDYFRSAYKSLRKKIINIDFPIALGIIAIFVRSLVDIITQSGEGYFDSLTGLVFFLLIGKWYQSKSYSTLSFDRNYKSYFPIAVNKVDEDNNEENIMLEQLKVGDTLLIRNSELIPADALLISNHAEIDYSFVSGESIPVNKKYGDRVYAGGKQKGSAIKVVIEKEVEQSYLTRLWTQNNSELSNKKDGNIKPIIDTISKYFSIIVLSIAGLTAIYWAIFNPSNIFNAFTSVLIIACPCALALVIPFAHGNMLRIFGKNGIYLKEISVVEQLPKLQQIVFDKTGTLTSSSESEITFNGSDLSQLEIKMIAGSARQSGHPLSIALAKYFKNIDIIEPDTFNEIEGKGIEAKFKDKLVRIGSPFFLEINTDDIEISGSSIFIEIEGVVKGYYTINNKYRDGLKPLLNKLSKQYTLHLISGDNDSQFKHLSGFFPDNSLLHFNQSPFEKLDYIESLKEDNQKILMVGDGLNDAGALAKSDVGISIADDIYHFSPACDVIMEAKRFNHLDRMLELARSVRSIVYLCFLISFIYNAVGLYFAVQNLISPLFAAILMPASSVMVVSIAALGTRFLALRKGFKL